MMERQELNRVLAESKLYHQTNGKQGARADFRDTNLSNANWSNADLFGANLRNADLRGADLIDANLRDANLSGAVLSDANLYSAKLSGADLGGADLSDAVLGDAVLRGANLRGADLSAANLSGADLYGAVLSGAVLSGKASPSAIQMVLKIAELVLSNVHKLEMGDVHTCETTHCLAGWVCTLDSTAKTLEGIIGWNAAACIAIPVPKFTRLFHSSNEEVIFFLKEVQATQGKCLS